MRRSDPLAAQVYPGIAWPNSTLGDCGQECFAHAVAVPANLSDPDLKDWVKPEYNPVVTNTQRDPSTAWRTSFGEWRYTFYDGSVFASDDFKNWTNVGKLFGKAECPDFFELPSDCEGCSAPTTAQGERPTHVHATANYEIGTYDEGGPMTPGTWKTLEGATGRLDGIGSDFFYASKSFWDPVKSRRIMWGWVRAGLGSSSASVADHDECDLENGNARVNMNSLARETNYDPLLKQLTFFPIAELRQPGSEGRGLEESGGRLLSGGPSREVCRTSLGRLRSFVETRYLVRSSLPGRGRARRSYSMPLSSPRRSPIREEVGRLRARRAIATTTRLSGESRATPQAVVPGSNSEATRSPRSPRRRSRRTKTSPSTCPPPRASSQRRASPSSFRRRPCASASRS